MIKQLSPITPKQREVLEFLKSFLAENGFPPTRGEIAEHFGFKSPNAADENLRSLVKKGFIKLSAGKFRGITIIKHHTVEPNEMVVPDGWQLVPIEPTEAMVIQGFESEPEEDDEELETLSGCQQAAQRAKLCWLAMLAAAPKPEREA
ncbi:LexA repressor [Rouxiella badensis]|nr:LexA repressor [Rouxiella badensis]